MYKKLARLCDSVGLTHIFVLKGQDTLYIGTKWHPTLDTDKILWKKYDVKSATEVYELMGIWSTERVVSLLMDK